MSMQTAAMSAPARDVGRPQRAIYELEMAGRMLETLRDAELVEIPGAYHHVTLDTPEAFTAALETFLRRML